MGGETVTDTAVARLEEVEGEVGRVGLVTFDVTPRQFLRIGGTGCRPGTTGRSSAHATSRPCSRWTGRSPARSLACPRLRALRERMFDRAGVDASERVLDAGCGTGTLAIAATQRVGPAGSPSGRYAPLIAPKPEGAAGTPACPRA